jgi:hypothetical protein
MMTVNTLDNLLLDKSFVPVPVLRRDEAPSLPSSGSCISDREAI